MTCEALGIRPRTREAAAARGLAGRMWDRLIDIRYEDGAWPLLRADRGLRYTLKSLAHARGTHGDENRAHFARMRGYVATLPRSATGGGPHTRTLRVAAMGDVMWIPAGWDGLLSPELERVLAGFDLRFANLETPVDPRRPVPRVTCARYNAPAAVLPAWRRRIGATVFSLVNNHALDQGLAGLERTRLEVESHRGHVAIGGVGEQDACRLVQSGRVRVGVIAVTYDLNPWHHGLTPGGYPSGIPRVRFGSRRHRADWPRVAALVERAREQGAELVVMLPHWGHEFEYWPDARCRADAYRLIEMGVDVILGSSPHVLQPVEVVSVDGWDPACPVQLARGGRPRAALVAHSLGNFTSSLPTRACNSGAVLDLTLRLGHDGGLDLAALRAWPTASRRRRWWSRAKRTELARAGEHRAHWERLLPMRGAEEPR